MGKLAFLVLDKGLDFVLSPPITWGGPIMGAALSGYLAFLENLPAVDIFQRVWIGWLLGCASIVAIVLLGMAIQKASLYGQIKGFDELSELRKETVERFWPIDKYDSLPKLRADYQEFKQRVASRLERHFTKSYANQYLIIGILEVLPSPGFPPDLPVGQRPEYMTLYRIVHRDLSWLYSEIEKFNNRYVTKTGEFKP